MNEHTVSVVTNRVALTSGFRTPQRPNHNGVDLGARPRGKPAIFSLWDGEIILLQHNNPSAGNWIEILHSNGYVTTYMHLDTIASKLAKGNRVRQGQHIGTMGNTGHSYGIHLHFEIRPTKARNGGRNAIDPMPILITEERTRMRINTIQEVPEDFRTFVQGMIDRGELSGTGQGLNISEDMIRNWIITERMVRNFLKRNGIIIGE
jgi:hypothetical protein